MRGKGRLVRAAKEQEAVRAGVRPRAEKTKCSRVRGPGAGLPCRIVPSHGPEAPLITAGANPKRCRGHAVQSQGREWGGTDGRTDGWMGDREGEATLSR